MSSPLINLPNVYIIIINWNGEDDTILCLESLTKVEYPNMHIVISDNGSDQASLDLIRSWVNSKKFKINQNDCIGIRSLNILENGRNLGFTGANTTGIHFSLNHGADYVMFLNNDTVVTPKFLFKMVSVAEDDASIGLVGCKTFHSVTSPNSSRGLIWSLGGYGYYFGNPMNLGSNQLDREEWTGVIKNDLICGCCMLIRREVIEQCGVQDDDLFFAIDDVEYSLRVARAGWKNVISLDAEITHAAARSTESRIGLRLYYLFRNTYYFRVKYFSWQKNILFFIHHLIRYCFIGTFGRILLGRSEANIGMFLGIKDFILRRYGECQHKQLLIKKSD
jgi:GT2 family glycosyltransferase